MIGDRHNHDVTTERLAERIVQLEAELDAARAEIARLSASARQNTAGPAVSSVEPVVPRTLAEMLRVDPAGPQAQKLHDDLEAIAEAERQAYRLAASVWIGAT